MATVEFIQKRINGKEAELKTLSNRLVRITDAKNSNWEKNPYNYNEYDLRATVTDIEKATKQLNSYKEQLQEIVDKNNSRTVAPILEFLDSWKRRVFLQYHEGLSSYYDDISILEALRSAVVELPKGAEREECERKRKEFSTKFREECIGTFEPIPEDDPGYRKYYNVKRKVKTGKYEWLKDYFKYSTIDDAERALTTHLETEANNKYDYLIERVCKIVGTITDASNLCISDSGELNGVIQGSTGKASVSTIGAGGYNIQIFHYRTLIHEIK